MGILSVDLHNINLDDINFDEDDVTFDEDDHDTIFHFKLMAWGNRYKQRKVCKKDTSKELMSLVWYTTRWWDWCMPEDEKKK